MVLDWIILIAFVLAISLYILFRLRPQDVMDYGEFYLLFMNFCVTMIVSAFGALLGVFLSWNIINSKADPVYITSQLFFLYSSFIVLMFFGMIGLKTMELKVKKMKKVKK